jgi:hypothetical protein
MEEISDVSSGRGGGIQTLVRRNVEAAQPSCFDPDLPAAARTLEAGFVRELCVQATASERVDVRGAVIQGRLDLSDKDLAAGLRLDRCRLDEVVLTRARLPDVRLSGCRLSSLRADRVTVAGSLLLDHVHARAGVHLRGADVADQLSLTAARLEDPRGGPVLVANGAIMRHVRMDGGFVARGEVILRSATIRDELNCTDGSFLHRRGASLAADGLQVGRDVYLNGKCCCLGVVRLSGANIGRQLNCTGGTFIARGKASIDANGLVVGGNVFFDRGFRCRGSVQLAGASISGNLNCTNARFDAGASAVALDLERAEVRGDVYLNTDPSGGEPLDATEFRTRGEVNLRGLYVGRQLTCTGGHFVASSAEQSVSLRGDGLDVDGDVFLDRGFRAVGSVRLIEAEIGRQLNCTNASFCADGWAIDASMVQVGTDVYLNSDAKASGTATGQRFVAPHGGLCFVGARVGHRLDLTGARVGPAGGEVEHGAVAAAGPVGGVDLTGGRLGSLVCRRAQLRSIAEGGAPMGRRAAMPALKAEHLRVDGEVVLTGIRATGVGGVTFARSVIGRSLIAASCRLESTSAQYPAFDVCGATVTGDLKWTPESVRGGVRLADATIGRLADDMPEKPLRWIDRHAPRRRPLSEAPDWPAGWKPEAPTDAVDGGYLVDLTGLEYTGLHPPSDAVHRCEWLRRSPYSPQPYAQLAAFYRRSGEIDEAVTVSVERYRRRLAEKKESRHAAAWNRVLRVTVGYGYRPHYALYWLFAAWLVLAVVLAANEQYLAPAGLHGEARRDYSAVTCTSDYHCYSAPVYALDVLLPIVDLRQTSAWQPDASRAPWGLSALLYLGAGVGWLLGAALIAGVGKVWRRE